MPKIVVRNVPVLPTEGFIRLPQVLSVFPVSKTRWYRGMRLGLYPKPIKLGGSKSVGWDVAAIRELIQRVSAGQGAA